jgi:hypothetical protein
VTFFGRRTCDVTADRATATAHLPQMTNLSLTVIAEP